MYVETGHLLYADAAGSLWAVEFDVDRGAEVGDAGARASTGYPVFRGYWAQYSVSRNGTMVYQTRSSGGQPSGSSSFL